MEGTESFNISGSVSTCPNQSVNATSVVTIMDNDRKWGGNEVIGSTEYQKPMQTCIRHRLNNMLLQMVEPRLYLLEQNILVHGALTKYYYIQSKITRCVGHTIAVQLLYVSIRHPVSFIFTWLLY